MVVLNEVISTKAIIYHLGMVGAAIYYLLANMHSFSKQATSNWLTVWAIVLVRHACLLSLFRFHVHYSTFLDLISSLQWKIGLVPRAYHGSDGLTRHKIEIRITSIHFRPTQH